MNSSVQDRSALSFGSNMIDFRRTYLHISSLNYRHHNERENVYRMEYVEIYRKFQ